MNSLQHASSPLVTPLLALWRWLMARPGSGQIDHQTRARAHSPAQLNAARVELTPTHRARSVAVPSARHPLHTRVARPLRVLQVVEAGQSPGHGARLRISGRMADVCAELDRLAAREALLR